MTIDPTAIEGPNFITYVDQNGKYYRIYTDPSGNTYTLNPSGTKSYITSFPTTPGTNYKVYTDALGTQFTVYTVTNGDTFTEYQYTKNNRFYYDVNCKRIPLSGALTPGQSNAGNLPAYSGFGIVLLDDSGNRYVLNSDKSWNYLFLAPGTSSSANPGMYRDSNSSNYLIYTDPSTRNRYVKNPDETRTYINGFPTSTYGTPFSFNDIYGNVYTVYSDPDGNKYVTYSDPKGKYYLTNSGSKVYLPQTVIPTDSGNKIDGITSIPGTTTTGNFNLEEVDHLFIFSLTVQEETDIILIAMAIEFI